ncbi:MAG: hypothetical protein Phog2KO_11220 [Phototrophicaceae bacterium]
MRLFYKFLVSMAISATTIIIIYTLSIFSGFALVPWDTSTIRPEIGTWQRRLNDFFEVGLGHSLVYIVVFLMVVIPIMTALNNRWRNYHRILLLNSLFIASFFFTTMIIYPVNHFIFPYTRDYSDPFFHNYGQQIIPFLTLWLVYSLWLYQINKLPKTVTKQKNKSKNTLAEASTARLNDTDTNNNFSLYQDNHVQSADFASQS